MAETGSESKEDATDVIPWIDELQEAWDLSQADRESLLAAATAVLGGEMADLGRSFRPDIFRVAHEVAHAVRIAREHPGFYIAMFDPLGLRAAAEVELAGSLWTTKEVSQRLALYGNHERHEPFLTWWESGLLPPRVLRGVVLETWALVRTGRIDTGIWVDMFRSVGFVAEPSHLNPPRTSMTLWRGTTRSGWQRLAWSTDPVIAAWFAWRVPRTRSAQYGYLFEAIVEPHHVLAIATEGGESEVIVDPAGLNLGENVTLTRRFDRDSANPKDVAASLSREGGGAPEGSGREPA